MSAAMAQKKEGLNGMSENEKLEQASVEEEGVLELLVPYSFI